MTTEYLLPAAGVTGGITGGFNLYRWGSTGQGSIGIASVSTTQYLPVQIGTSEDWAQVNAGSGVCFAIKTNGTLWSWGGNNLGQLGQGNVINTSSPVQIGALTDWAQVNCASTICAAIKTNGTLWTWGVGTGGQLGDGTVVNKSSPVQIGALTDWARVSAGDTNCAAIKTNGTLWTWGIGTGGQLGDGTVVNKSSPVQIGALSDWAQVSMGNNFCAAIKTNGTLWTWGTNANGQLGDGTVVSKSSPVQIGALSDWAQVQASNGSVARYCLAIKTDGTLWSWGQNSLGSLGDGTNISRSSPVQIGVLSDWSQVSVASGTARGGYAVKTNGTLWGWGSSVDFGLTTAEPIQIGNLSNWSQVDRGSTEQIVRDTNNRIYSWGVDAGGSLGLNLGLGVNSPVFVGSNYTLVSNSSNFAIAVKSDGTLWGWGLNSSGRLGTGNLKSTIVPIQIGASKDWAQVSVPFGVNGYCEAIKTNGTLWGWGINSSGQLGDGTVVSKSSPVQIGALSDWAQVSAGGTWCMAIKTNNTLWSWGGGGGNAGILGSNTNIARSSPVQVGTLSDWAQVSSGDAHCAAIKTNGTLWTWGSNLGGQLGQNIGITVFRSSPVQVGALSDWARVSAGTSICAAIKTNGTLWTWGVNTSGQLGISSSSASRSSPVQVGTLSDWALVSASNEFCVAVKTNGTLWAWGRNDLNQLGDGTIVNRSSPVQIGSLLNWTSPNTGMSETSGALSS